MACALSVFLRGASRSRSRALAPFFGDSLKTFDRYLLSRFLSGFAVFFVAAFGLYVVFDGFTNLDGFVEKNEAGGAIAIARHMGMHYACHASLLFELIGPAMAVVSVMMVLVILSKHGELNPLLAAGIPTLRLTWPLACGMLLVNGLLILNQELIIPKVAHHLQGARGSKLDDARHVEPCLSTQGIYVTGSELYLDERRLHEAEFRLLRGTIAQDYITLKAENAYHLPAKGRWPAGWLLKEAEPPYEKINLTPQGKHVVIPVTGTNDLFVVSEVTTGQLYQRNRSFKYLSTAELSTRLQQPSTGTSSALAQAVHFHSRLTRPLLSLATIFLIVPLIIRKEKTNLVSNVALCLLMLGMVFSLSYGVAFLGETGVLRPDLAAWIPLMTTSGLSAWLNPSLRT
ncbi:MAG: LptF/LptG family permease [Planctomycetaceae bacterium]